MKKSIIIAVCCALMGSTFAQETPIVKDDFTKQIETLSEKKRQETVKHVQNIKKAIIQVEVIWQVNVSNNGQQHTQEAPVRVNGTVVNENGLTILCLSSTDPAIAARRQIAKATIETTVQKAKIISEDGTEVEAEIILRDEELDLLYLKPKEVTKKYDFINLKNNDKAKLFGPYFSLQVLPEEFGRATVILGGYVISELTKPKKVHLVTTPTPGMPLITEEGKVLGICLSPKVMRGEFCLVSSEEVLENMAQVEE